MMEDMNKLAVSSLIVVASAVQQASAQKPVVTGPPAGSPAASLQDEVAKLKELTQQLRDRCGTDRLEAANGAPALLWCERLAERISTQDEHVYALNDHSNAFYATAQPASQDATHALNTFHTAYGHDKLKYEPREIAIPEMLKAAMGSSLESVPADLRQHVAGVVWDLNRASSSQAVLSFNIVSREFELELGARSSLTAQSLQDALNAGGSGPYTVRKDDYQGPDGAPHTQLVIALPPRGETPRT